MNAIDLMPRAFALLAIQLRGSGARQPPLGSVYNRGHQLQIAQQFGGCGCGFLFLPLRFEKQLRLSQEALADRGRALAPGGIQLPGCTRIAVMLGEDRGHPLAVLRALARHRHQKLHRHLRRDLSFANLLLDGFRQKLDQRQPPRYPAHAAVKPARQLIEAIAETLLQFLQQPAHLQRALVFG